MFGWPVTDNDRDYTYGLDVWQWYNRRSGGRRCRGVQDRQCVGCSSEEGDCPAPHPACLPAGKLNQIPCSVGVRAEHGEGVAKKDLRERWVVGTWISAHVG